MKIVSRYLPLFALVFLFQSCNKEKAQETNEQKPPSPEKVAHELTAHGNKRVDNYYWMKLSDEQKNAEKKDDQTQKVLSYLNAENDYLKTKLQHTEGLQEKLYNEIIGRIKQTDESVPYKDNGYWYYSRYEQGQEYPIYCLPKATTIFRYAAQT